MKIYTLCKTHRLSRELLIKRLFENMPIDHYRPIFSQYHRRGSNRKTMRTVGVSLDKALHQKVSELGFAYRLMFHDVINVVFFSFPDDHYAPVLAPGCDRKTMTCIRQAFKAGLPPDKIAAIAKILFD